MSQTLFNCPKCGELKPREDFYGVRKRSGWCKLCTSARSAAYYAANKDKQKAAHREWVKNNRDRVAAHKAKSAYGIPSTNTNSSCAKASARSAATPNGCASTIVTYRNACAASSATPATRGSAFSVTTLRGSELRSATSSASNKPDIFAATHEAVDD